MRASRRRGRWRAQAGDRLAAGSARAAPGRARRGAVVPGQAAGQHAVDELRRQRVLARAARRAPASSGVTSRSPPTATAVGRGVRGELAGDEQVVVAGRRVPRRAQAGRAERPLGRGEQPGVARRVDVGAVDRRVGVRRPPARPGSRGAPESGSHAPAVEHRARQRQLVGLRVVDEVAGDEHGVGARRVRPRARRRRAPGSRAPPAGGRSSDSGSPRRSRKGTRAGDSSSRTCDVGELREASRACGRARRRAPRSRAVAQRLARPALEEAVAVGVAPASRVRVEPRGPRSRRARRRRSRRAQDGGEREREAPSARHHSSRSPCDRRLGDRRGARPRPRPRAPRSARPPSDERGLAGRGRRRQVGVARGEARRRAARARARSSAHGERPRRAARRRAPRPPSTAPTVAPSAPVARSSASVGAALARGEAERLHERVEAHERVDERHDRAAARPARRGRRRCASSPRRPRPAGRRAPQPPRRPRARSAPATEPDHDLGLQRPGRRPAGGRGRT